MSKLDGLEFRALVVQGIDVCHGNYIEYRRLPNMAFTIPFSVYGNRFDFIMYGQGSAYPKVVAGNIAGCCRCLQITISSFVGTLYSDY